jgi:hypothetical protein
MFLRWQVSCLASNCDPPNIHFLRIWNYEFVPPCLTQKQQIQFFKICYHCSGSHLQKFLQYIKYITSELIPSTILLYPLPRPCNSVNRYHFSIYILVYTVFAPYSPSYTFSHILPPPTANNARHPGKTCSTHLFSDFIKETKLIFLFV